MYFMTEKWNNPSSLLPIFIYYLAVWSVENKSTHIEKCLNYKKIRFLNWKIVHIPVSSMIFASINKNNLGVSIKIHPYGNFLVRTHVFGIDLELHSFVCRQIGFRHSINIRQ